MPKITSPEAALARVEGLSESSNNTEPLGARLPVRLWRKIAEYARDRGLRDMSSGLRAVLEEWEAMSGLQTTKSLDDMPTEVLAAALRARGLLVMDRDQFYEELTAALLSFKGKLKEVVEETLNPEKVLKMMRRAEKKGK